MTDIQRSIISQFKGVFITRLELSYRSGLPIQEVNQEIKTLVDQGIVVERKITGSNGKIRGGIYNLPRQNLKNHD